MNGQASELTIEQCGENIVYGNEKEHGVLRTLEELEELEEHGESLERQRKNIIGGPTSGRTSTKPNQTTAEILELTYGGPPGYDSRKHMYMDTYKKAIFFLTFTEETSSQAPAKIPTLQGDPIFGNSVAHDGDAGGGNAFPLRVWQKVRSYTVCMCRP